MPSKMGAQGETESISSFSTFVTFIKAQIFEKVLQHTKKPVVEHLLTKYAIGPEHNL